MAKTYCNTSNIGSIISWTEGWIDEFKEGKSEGIIFREKNPNERWSNKKFLTVNKFGITICRKTNLYKAVHISLETDKQREGAFKLLRPVFIFAPYILCETPDKDFVYRKVDSKLKFLRRCLGIDYE